MKQEAKNSRGEKIQVSYSLNEDVIAEEKRYDGFYAVETNLDDGVSDILKINYGRWEIEESFRIMKDEFLARPAYLSRADRIKAHFMTCFMSLLVYRVMEKKLGERYTCDQIVSTLWKMSVTKAQDVGWVPAYTPTDITDALHEYAGFLTDYELIRTKSMQGIIRKSKIR